MDGPSLLDAIGLIGSVGSVPFKIALLNMALLLILMKIIKKRRRKRGHEVPGWAIGKHLRHLDEKGHLSREPKLRKKARIESFMTYRERHYRK